MRVVAAIVAMMLVMFAVMHPLRRFGSGSRLSERHSGRSWQRCRA